MKCHLRPFPFYSVPFPASVRTKVVSADPCIGLIIADSDVTRKI